MNNFLKYEKQLKVDLLDCVSVENMRRSDAETIARSVPGKQLMYRAASGIFRAVSWRGPIAIVVGSGNNGGDGYALACILKEKGYDSTLFPLSEKQSEDGAYYADLARKAGIPSLPYQRGCLAGFAMVVDCLLGTGFQGTVRGVYRDAIEEINGSGAIVVSADINSGMNGDTGQAELAVRSDVTVTIGFVKKGLVAPAAGAYIRRLVCTDIGIHLLREEDKLTAENAPPWLEMRVISGFEDA